MHATEAKVYGGVLPAAGSAGVCMQWTQTVAAADRRENTGASSAIWMICGSLSEKRLLKLTRLSKQVSESLLLCVLRQSFTQ